MVLTTLYIVSVIVSLAFTWWYDGTDLRNLGGYKGAYNTFGGLERVVLWLLMIIPVMNLLILAMMTFNYYHERQRSMSRWIERSNEPELEFMTQETSIRIRSINRNWSIPIKKINSDPMLLQEYTTHAKSHLADWNGKIRSLKQAKAYADQLIKEARREARENRPQERRGGRLL